MLATGSESVTAIQRHSAEFNGSRLAAGRITHCGCRRASHGHTAGGKRTPTYVAWQDMIARCKDAAFVGADGVMQYPRRYSSRWRTFDGFLKDMGERPPGKTLDRINTLDGSYIKSNCRWATRQQQDYNKTNNVMYFVDPENDDVSGTALDWAEFFSVRLNIPMSPEEFRIIVKFFTVGQLWCSLHPLAPNAQQLRQGIEDQKAKKFAAMWDRANPGKPEDTGWVDDDHDIEDTGRTED